uniref:Uncharacterized protein n=1 Tax=Acrobeloides nanus TaxID=290746 RepID=A0A914DTM6_9BILA
MTLNWCYATYLNNLALTAAVSCLILFGIKYKRFIPNFLDLLLIATRNKIPTLGQRRRRMLFFAVVLYMASSIVYCIENTSRYNDFEVNGTIRDNARFRNSMFGMQWLFPIDIAIIIWGAVVTSVAISITSCMNLGICMAYKEFNEEIKKLIQNGEIKLDQTKEMFYLEKSLWINVGSSIRDLAFSITDRLEKLIASSNTIGTSRSAFFILNLLLLIIPFIADVLSVFVNGKSTGNH